MQIFDSHCHLDDDAYAGDLDQVMARAGEAEVQAMMVVGLGLASSERAIAMAGQYKGLYVSLGIHPHDARTCGEDALQDLRALASHRQVKAWGETGLDFNRMHSPIEAQESCFTRQLELAAELALPMIFHERESQGRFLEILKSNWTTGRHGVVHCFSGTDQELDAYLELGLYIGITGIVTIKGRGRDLRRQVPRIPPAQLVVETDAPYLTPTPWRNKFRRNEPAFVRSVLLKVAELRGLEPGELAGQTWRNTCALFNIEG